jgi:hypothetical protein
MFEAVLAKLQIKSGGSKGMKSKFKTKLVRGEESEEQRFPISEYPTKLSLPIFGSPRIIRYKHATNNPESIQLVNLYFGEAFSLQVINILTATGADQITVMPLKMPINDFRRMLAKMAHCYAIAKVGVDGFTPLLRDVILNEDCDASHFVGSTVYPRKLANATHHNLDIGSVKHPDYAEPFLIVMTRLFGRHDAVPCYITVVGMFNAVTARRLPADALPKDA